MAKSLRASGKKANRAKLRVRVFGPVEAARNERLSRKLQAISNSVRSQEVEMPDQGRPEEKAQTGRQQQDKNRKASQAEKDEVDEWDGIETDRGKTPIYLSKQRLSSD